MFQPLFQSLSLNQSIGNTKCILNAAHMQNRTSSCQSQVSQSVYVWRSLRCTQCKQRTEINNKPLQQQLHKKNQKCLSLNWIHSAQVNSRCLYISVFFTLLLFGNFFYFDLFRFVSFVLFCYSSKFAALIYHVFQFQFTRFAFAGNNSIAFLLYN